jgi:hypothetical protein
MRSAKTILLLLIAFLLPIGGCEFECNMDDDNAVEDAVDEIGDEAEDVADEINDDDV